VGIKVKGRSHDFVRKTFPTSASMKVYANGIPPVVHVVRVSSLGVFLLRL